MCGVPPRLAPCSESMCGVPPSLYTLFLCGVPTNLVLCLEHFGYVQLARYSQAQLVSSSVALLAELVFSFIKQRKCEFLK